MSDQPPEPSEPSQRVRVTKLQETQVDAVVALDRVAKEAIHRAGVSADDAPARSLADVVALTRLHDVLVAEVDGVVAGYAAWRDESPGVAYLEDIAVLPEMQRFAVGHHLLDEVRRRARAVALPVLLTRSWEAAEGRRAFFARAHLTPLADGVPDTVAERVAAWREEQASTGPSANDGQVVLFQPLL